MKNIAAISLCAFVLVACATNDAAKKKDRPVRLAPDLDLPSEPRDPNAPRPSPLPPGANDLTNEDLARRFAAQLKVESAAQPALFDENDSDAAFWKDPDVRRRFNESFISETDIEPKYNPIEADLIQQVLELMSNEKVDEAIALIEQNRGPAASAALDANLGVIRFTRNELPEAISCYEAAVAKHPKFRRAWSNLGAAYFRLGKYAEAIPALTRAIETGAVNGLNFGFLGYCYLTIENSLSAESAYRMALLLDPKTEDWKLGLVRCFFKQRRYADVVALTGELLAAKPERADLWQMQASAYAGLGQPMRAAENYEFLERLGKLDAANLLNLGDIYINEELFDLGVGAYSRAIAADVSVGSARPIRAARSLVGRGASREAGELLAAIEAAFPQLEVEPRKEVLRLRARLAVASGGGAEEASILEEIVQLDPLDGRALIDLGKYYGAQGDIERAILYFERGAGIEAFEADAKVGHAQLLVQKQRYAEALPLLRRAQTLKPRENIQKFLEEVERVAQSKGQ